MTNISATIITYNEERNIERCLNALIGVADEIVVVDSFSTDGTEDICKRYGCRVVSRAFSGYGSQRQYAMSLTSHRYVLSIDADEVLSEELREAMMRLKETDELRNHRMYSIEMVSYIGGEAVRHSYYGPHPEVRLFDKRYATWDLRDVGERVRYSDSVVPHRLPGCIHHYRSHTLAEFEAKELRHAALRARVYAAKGETGHPVKGILKGFGAYMGCLIGDGAWLDGKVGRHIARVRYKSVRASYRGARKIRKPES